MEDQGKIKLYQFLFKYILMPSILVLGAIAGYALFVAAFDYVSGTNELDGNTTFYTLKNGSVCVKSEINQDIENGEGRFIQSVDVVDCSAVNSDFKTLEQNEVPVNGTILHSQYTESCESGGHSKGVGVFKTGEYIEYNEDQQECISINTKLIAIEKVKIGGGCELELPRRETKSHTIDCDTVFSESKSS